MCVDPEQSERRRRRRKTDKRIRRILTKRPTINVTPRLAIPDPRPRLLARAAELDIIDETVGGDRDPFDPFEKDEFDARALALHTRRTVMKPTIRAAKSYLRRRRHEELSELAVA